MMRKNLLFPLMLASMAFSVSAEDYLTVFMKDGDATRVRSIPADSIEAIRYGHLSSGASAADDESVQLEKTFNILLNDGGYRSFPLDSVTSYGFNALVPALYINTDEYVEEITSKTDYLSAKFTMDSHGRYEDVENVKVNIRGRGNTTWGMPKKPYRLKFDKKISLFGLPKAKSYALIANHIDYTQMSNAIAFRTAQLLDLPYTNHSIPVDVYLNGIYKGSYQFTEKVGINSGSVDIEETTGILWEIDTNFDDDYRFESPVYKLKVMVKDPDFAELAEDDPMVSAGDRFEIWKGDFVRMEKAVKEGRWTEEFDVKSMIDYFIVYNFTCNREISHPKSTYLYKEKIGEKYKMGPVWDFDWAFNYVNPPDRQLIETWLTGMNFFFDIVKTPEFKKAYEERWAYFKENVYPQVMAYIDYYAALIRVSALKNGELWPASRNVRTTETFDRNVEELKAWIVKRMEFIDNDVNCGIIR